MVLQRQHKLKAQTHADLRKHMGMDNSKAGSVNIAMNRKKPYKDSKNNKRAADR